MRLTQDDDMIHALAPDRSDQPLGKAILPRRRRGDGLVPIPIARNRRVTIRRHRRDPHRGSDSAEPHSQGNASVS